MGSFIFYESFHEAIRLLPEKERLEAYETICAYALWGEEPEELLPGTEIVFTLVRPQIDANNQRRSNGSHGGRPKKPKNTDLKTDGLADEKPMVIDKKTNGFENKNQRLKNKKPNVNVNDNVNANVNANDNVNVNTYSCAFEEAWKAYPRKKEKAKAYKCYKARLKEGYTEEQLALAVDRYATECQRLGTEERFIKHGATFFGSSLPFADYLSEDYRPPDSKKKANQFHNFDQREYGSDIYAKIQKAKGWS